jgi:hypothetical protein
MCINEKRGAGSETLAVTETDMQKKRQENGEIEHQHH